MDAQLKENILQAFGLTGLSPEEQDEIVAKIGGTVFQSVLVKAIDGMDADAQKAFESKLAASDESPEAVIEALRASVPNFSEMVQAEVAHLADESRRILSPDDSQ